MDRSVTAGRLLAQRHHDSPPSTSTDHDEAQFLVNYAESPRAGDWSLRSALVRLAQPEPIRARLVIELIRRLDGALQPLHRARAISPVVLCDRSLPPATDFEPAPGEGAGLPSPTSPYHDHRLVDLARLTRTVAGGGKAQVLDAYGTEAVRLGDQPLSSDERGAIELVAVALRFDRLAEELVTWAGGSLRDPPLGAVDDACTDIGRRLDELGVPSEDRGGRPPPRSGRD